MNTPANEFEIKYRNVQVTRAFRKLREPLCAYVRRKTGDVAEVEDLVQDVFEAVLTTSRLFLDDNSLTRFAYVCARNRIADYFRRNACTRKSQEFFGSFSNIPVNEADSLANCREILRLEKSALNCVGEKARIVYLMNVHWNIPARKISKSMGISVRTVQNHVFRVKDSIRSELRQII